MRKRNRVCPPRIITPEVELKDLSEINKKMLETEGIIYLPDMWCLTTREIYTAFFNDGKKCGDNLTTLFRNKLYPLVSSPKYRAQMRLLYEQFPIFQGLLPLLDEILFSFFQSRFNVSYVALFPVVEGLLLRWANKKKEIKDFKMYDFISSKKNDILKKHPNDAWCKHNFDLLEFIICNFLFKHSDKKSVETMFNRNVMMHLLNDPTTPISHKNCMRLLTIIDLIANCYLYDYPLEAGGTIGNTACYKYQEEGQEEIKRLTITYYLIQELTQLPKSN